MAENSKKVQKCAIKSNKMVAKGYFVMEIENEWLSEVSLPGQFISLKAGDNTMDPLLRIPLGIHKIGEKEISVLYKVVGKGTKLLSSKKAGEEIDVLGPLGNSFDIRGIKEKKEPYIVIASGGHGIAPLYALADRILKENASCKIHFFIGACTKEEVLCEKELKEMGLKVDISTDDGSHGCQGYVTDLMGEVVKDKPDEVFACGPRGMLAAIAAHTKQNHFKTQVSLDAYMACGVGACLGCAIKTNEGYKLVCKDGPIFAAGEIVWEEAVEGQGSCVCD